MFFVKGSNRVKEALHDINSDLPKLISLSIAQDESLVDNQYHIDSLIEKAAKLYELNHPEFKVQKDIKLTQRWTPPEEINDFLSKSIYIYGGIIKISKLSFMKLNNCTSTSNKISSEIKRLENAGTKNKELDYISELNNKRLESLGKIERILRIVNDYALTISDSSKKAIVCEKQKDFEEILKQIDIQKSNLISTVKNEVILTKEEESILAIDYKLIEERFDTKGIMEIYANMKKRKTRKLYNKCIKWTAEILLLANLVTVGAATYFTNMPAPWISKKNYDTEIAQQLSNFAEKVNFKSNDGISLNGTIYRNIHADKTKIIIMLHEFSFNASHMLKVVKHYQKHYNVFIFDTRGVGDNMYGTSGVGYDEKEDLKGALDFLSTKGFRSVVIHGVSQGAAATVFALGEYKNLNLEIKAIILQACYADLESAINERKMYKIPAFINNQSNWLTEKIKGIRLKDISPEKAISRINVPILIVQDYDDEFMPISHGQRLWEKVKNKPNAEKLFLQGTYHLDDRPGTLDKLEGYIERNL